MGVIVVVIVRVFVFRPSSSMINLRTGRGLDIDTTMSLRLMEPETGKSRNIRHGKVGNARIAGESALRNPPP